MLEMRYIRENADKIKEYLKNRNSDFDLDSLLKLDEDRRNLLQEVEMLKKERNESSSLIGKYKQEGKDPAELLARMQTVSAKIKELDQKVAEIDEKQVQLAYTIPNKLSDTTPIGKDEDENVEVRKWGTPREFDFEIKSHQKNFLILLLANFHRNVF